MHIGEKEIDYCKHFLNLRNRSHHWLSKNSDVGTSCSFKSKEVTGDMPFGMDEKELITYSFMKGSARKQGQMQEGTGRNRQR